MWLGKFVDLEEDLGDLRNKRNLGIFKDIKLKKLTPLEFTIIETIFNFGGLSGYDLIQKLNKHFAGTWVAKSGTVYPILTKLEMCGFLQSNMIKTPIGPIRKVYFLSEAGETILKLKVSNNFNDQLKFIENYLVELSSIYIRSNPKSEREVQLKLVEETLKDSFQNIMEWIPSLLEYKIICGNCSSEINRKAIYCPYCGYGLSSNMKSEN
ncbi:MAG: helix-turn-helix transcriptional regulator [Promethearchaeota archaeon]